jgi:hypothetical protein
MISADVQKAISIGFRQLMNDHRTSDTAVIDGVLFAAVAYSCGLPLLPDEVKELRNKLHDCGFSKTKSTSSWAAVRCAMPRCASKVHRGLLFF